MGTDSSPSETAEVTIRRKAEFDFGDRLGRGGYGRVYKAQHRQQKTFYAIKVVPDRGESRKEVEALASLKHCNIVQYFSCWEESSDVQSTNSLDSTQSSDDSCKSFLYIQLELCKPETLRHRIDRWNDTEDLPDSERREESRAVMLQIVAGVEYIHAQGFTHRDLKPANILFGLDDKVKIGDFGLVTTEELDEAAEVADEMMEESDEMMEESDEMTEEPEYQIAELYMAPEQLEKNRGRKIDIFPLGLIYFELLWKLSTYHERAEIWSDLRKQEYPEKFREYFNQEFGIVNAMLRPNPENRPEASALKEDLQEFIRTRSTSVSGVTANQIN